MIRECLLGFFLMCMMFEVSAATSRPPAEGLVLWLDGADASNLSLNQQGRVLSWLDKSGHGNDVNADNAAPGALPEYVSAAINGHGVVRLNGTAAFSAKALRSAKGPVTLLVVSRRLPEQAGGKAWQRLFSSRPQLADNDNVAPNFGISVQQTTAYEPALAFLEAGDVPIGPLAVGRNVVGTSEILRGDIAEVLVYDRPFATQAERQAAFEYLAQKWKVTIPSQANAWTRTGPLGPLPQRTNPDLPLSDQANAGQWQLDSRLSDDFNGNTLDPGRWHVNDATGTDSLGRKPALFLPENASVSDGYLNIVFRKQTLPDKYVRLGYKDYSSAMVRTIERGSYGYYEARARPMNSAGSSAFWLAWTGLADNATEIDVFEIGGKTKDAKFDRMYNMNAHVWATPTSTAHLAEGSSWISPWRFADNFHVYGLDWQPDTLRWYVDGVLVREAKNSHWFFPMQIVFDSEAMWDWFGVVDDADLPSTFSIDYVKVWRRGK
ncbi:glycoside hydrolase [Pseudomonas putida]|uniref:Glycoside hydrolase n=1 Tax=Pseudomonas putida TaxID=303 RepID=A0A2Z4RE16_PSEPU|nr:family 16 glycosylhydrolase [Pseudomonas putida]AWY38578.1 glycoside hydrolase [Pseudomonas putida]